MFWSRVHIRKRFKRLLARLQVGSLGTQTIQQQHDASKKSSRQQLQESCAPKKQEYMVRSVPSKNARHFCPRKQHARHLCPASTTVPRLSNIMRHLCVWGGLTAPCFSGLPTFPQHHGERRSPWDSNSQCTKSVKELWSETCNPTDARRRDISAPSCNHLSPTEKQPRHLCPDCGVGVWGRMSYSDCSLGL